MQYRSIPKSKDKLSVLGYGAMRLPTKGRGGMLGTIDIEEAKKQILYAIDNGVNYLDTAWPYHKGNSESFLGEHILTEEIRKKVYIATKLPCMFIKKQEKIEEIFSKQLTKLNVDYIDYYLMHSLDGPTWQKMLDFGIIEWMNQKRVEKKVRHMGFSFHGKPEDFIKIVDSYDWDFTQVQYNLLDGNFQAGEKGIEYAAKKDIGIFIMEPLRGGALVGKQPKAIQAIYDTYPEKRTGAEWAFKYIYNNPHVTLVLSGMNDMEHIKENIRVASETEVNSLSTQELKILEDVKTKYLELFKVGCTGCAYCLPCPQKIDIPGMFTNLNNYHMFSKAEAKMWHTVYNGIMPEDKKPHFASSCIKCGACEQKCPQHLEIMKHLDVVEKDLEGPILRTLSAMVRPFVNKTKK